jgi:hypothetical protein
LSGHLPQYPRGTPVFSQAVLRFSDDVKFRVGDEYFQPDIAGAQFIARFAVVGQVDRREQALTNVALIAGKRAFAPYGVAKSLDRSTVSPKDMGKLPDRVCAADRLSEDLNGGSFGDCVRRENRLRWRYEAGRWALPLR